MALVGVELETLVCEPDALTTLSCRVDSHTIALRRTPTSFFRKIRSTRNKRNEKHCCLMIERAQFISFVAAQLWQNKENQKS